MKLVTLQVNGREMTFSEEELEAILEKHFSSKTEQVTTVKVTQKPTEGAWFEVRPQTINPKLFLEKRNDTRQEETRRLILEAFLEMENNPKKYGRNFMTMMPEKKWEERTVEELKWMACKLGDHNANWVEKSLEWAQRIANGESWEDICNNPDTAKCFGVVVWKYGENRLVGGAIDFGNPSPASKVCRFNCRDCDILKTTVPTVVSYGN